ncbi:MAG: acyl-CoA dehydrogenase family protein [Hyphomicrobiales bacterium]|nr:acyl-CoA dehydrogenase family protein [Hyphomicrobiales bacterium]
MAQLNFAPPPPNTEATERLRGEVRGFLAKELAGMSAQKRASSWGGRDPDFSRKMAAQGWIGMTWPKKYGGHERTALERYVVLEEMLAAGAPVGAHWIADRQSAPSILRFGTEEQRQFFVPKIAKGECFFCIGMSEPDSGSDLAATRTRAVSVEGGFRVNGTKIWTSGANAAHYMILFCRTDQKGDDRHAGVSQFIVDMRTPGLTVRPIYDMSGYRQFNEVVFEDMFLPTSALLGNQGDGWKQVTSELAYERSGPDRFLSTFTLLIEGFGMLANRVDDRAAIALGRIIAHLMTLRRMSRSIAGMLQRGEDPATHAAVVKELGTSLEQEMVEVMRLLIDAEPDGSSNNPYIAVLAHTIMSAPSFSLRGGTREILRGMIARGLGLR